MFIDFLMVAIGASFGALARVLLSNWIKRKWIHTFPLATFVVNMSGALFLGFVTGLGPDPRLALLLGTGFIGTYTTFSTFNLENIELVRRKKNKAFIMYIAGSYSLGILAIGLGLLLGTALRANFAAAFVFFFSAIAI